MYKDLRKMAADLCRHISDLVVVLEKDFVADRKCVRTHIRGSALHNLLPLRVERKRAYAAAMVIYIRSCMISRNQ